MLKLPDIKTGLKTLREVDLNAIRYNAEQPEHIAVFGDSGTGKSTLIAELLTGSGNKPQSGIWPVTEHHLDNRIVSQPHTLALLLIDATALKHSRERTFFKILRDSNTPVVVCYNKIDLAHDRQALSNEAQQWSGAEVISISANNRKTLLQRLVPALLRTGKGHAISLARNLPILREPFCRRLIDDTSFINGSFSLTTGIAQINVLLNIPLNMADMVMLTKNQALMAYKIALAMGLSADWKVTIPKLATVIGSAFLWRQIARQLVGLIPAYGIIPKVAVSYAGTYVIGEAIYHWCASGEKLNASNLKAVYAKALDQGRRFAGTITAKRNRIQLAATRKLRQLTLPG